jgi:rhamnogalacturonan endolyase
VIDTTAYQYWADVDGHSGNVEIDRIKAGTYRLTVYADGIFGDFIQDNVVVRGGKMTDSRVLHWTAESSGKELWRIGTPDKAGGEWKHGATKDATHHAKAPEYRIYFGAYDFIENFPQGVNYHVGKSKENEDFNYIHWSVFGGYSNYKRPIEEAGHGQINNWTISFHVDECDLEKTKEATFTIQLAGAKTAAGNTDVVNATQAYSNMPFIVVVNGRELKPWIIP